jgi:GAF domain-containing protein
MADRSDETTAPDRSPETQRLAALHDYGILDTGPEGEFDDLVELASQIAGTPMSLISLVDEARQWFKARKGINVKETPRTVAFCAHAIEQAGIMEVPDASLDSRFANNPLVTGKPDLRFYAGVPLISPEGFALGTLCVLDSVPRPPLSAQQRNALQIVARQVMVQLELRKVLHGQRTLHNNLTSENRFLQDKVIEQTGELKVNAEALRQSQKMETIGQLTGGIAHDFNNLLQAIVGSIATSRQLIARNRVAEVERFLGIAASAAQRAGALTNRLLAFSRHEPAATATINVQPQLRTLLEIMRRICGQSIELTIDDYPGLWTIRCDPSQLENAVLNLVINARDAMRMGGRLHIGNLF